MELPSVVKQVVLQGSQPMPEGSRVVQGYDFNQGVDYHALLESYRTTGFQATHFGQAVEEINKMASVLVFVTPGISYKVANTYIDA